MNSYLRSVLKKCVASFLSGLLIISSLTICTFILLFFLISRKNMNLLHVVTLHILKGYVKVIILLTLNRSRRIIKCVVIGVLFTCVLIGLSSAPIFAASEDSLSSEVSSDFVFPDEYTDPVYHKLASGATRATVDLDDIYNALFHNNISVGDSVFFSANTLARHFSGTDGNYIDLTLNSISSSLSNSLSPMFATVANNTTSLDSKLSTTNSKLEYIFSAVEDTINIKWYDFGFIYDGVRGSLNGSLIGSADGRYFYPQFTANSDPRTDSPCLVRLFIPIAYNSVYDYQSNDIWTLDGVYYVAGGTTHSLPLPDHFIEITSNGFYIYMFDFHPYNYNTYVFAVHSVPTTSFNSSFPGTAVQIPFDTLDYQQIKTAFYQARSAQLANSDSDNIEALADYFVSPAKQAAEDASQPVIQDTLDGFTGNGSAAAKTSDTGSMKNMSGSIQSGLNSGASASNAASVFSNQTFWSWFTQSTSNGINNPYPAPVVQNTRVSGDYVPDFLSGNQAELNDLLNQRNSW